MLKLADLAARPDFRVGPLLVSPSRRLVEGPGGQANLEPRVMQVFVLLLDAGGKVVTRNQLFDQVWGGVMVGDDSLNRTVAAIRKLAAEVAGDSFEIETIPRTGYRLAGDIARFPDSREKESPGRRMSRRRLIAGSGAAAIVAGGGLWWADRRRREASFDRLLDQIGERLNNTDFDDDTRRLTERAVMRRPDSARAWGYLAGIRSVAAQTAPAVIETATVQKAVEAAEKALALDPNEPNALLAMFQLKGSTLDWLARDRTLRHIIALDPRNVLALTELVALLQAAGLNRESWTWNERALAIVPLSSDLLGRRALKLWIAGQLSGADKVIDQVRDLYPSDAWSAWIRFLILALSERPRAALGLLENQPSIAGSPPEIAMWRVALKALDGRDPTNVAAARKVLIESSRIGGNLAAQAVMALSDLGEVDAAFDVAEGFLLWRGPVVTSGKSPIKKPGGDSSWRIGVQWLFTPPCRVMRADRRFLPLCDGIGLTEYWSKRGVVPDYQRLER